jgi:hypothetical protein
MCEWYRKDRGGTKEGKNNKLVNNKGKGRNSMTVKWM